jgi:hypothetical protein
VAIPQLLHQKNFWEMILRIYDMAKPKYMENFFCLEEVIKRNETTNPWKIQGEEKYSKEYAEF